MKVRIKGKQEIVLTFYEGYPSDWWKLRDFIDENLTKNWRADFKK